MNTWDTLYALKEFHRSLKLQDDCESAYNFILKALRNGKTCLDIGVLNKYRENPDFIELCIICNILSLIDSPNKIEYISGSLNDFQIRRPVGTIITEDELFSYSIMSFIYSIFAIINAPDDPIVFENCFKNIITVLDLQARHLKFGVYNTEKVLNILDLPDNITHIASDTYYTIWTFQIAHEIYHILCHEDNSMEQEINADKFGYSVLIKLIEKQKQGKLIDDCKCFYEYTYLSPIILFEYLRLIDLWKELCGKRICPDNLHPSNEQRKEFIFSLFDEMIPDDFNTEDGNEILRYCLEVIDNIEDNIRIKALSGKLDSIKDTD